MLTQQNVTRGPAPREQWRYRAPRKCLPVQLSLSYSARTRQKLRALVRESGLPQGVFAQWVLGCDPVTICSYLKAGEIPKTRAFQINRIARVIVAADMVLVELAGFRASPRWRSRGARLTYENKKGRSCAAVQIIE